MLIQSYTNALSDLIHQSTVGKPQHTKVRKISVAKHIKFIDFDFKILGLASKLNLSWQAIAVMRKLVTSIADRFRLTPFKFHVVCPIIGQSTLVTMTSQQAAHRLTELM